MSTKVRVDQARVTEILSENKEALDFALREDILFYFGEDMDEILPVRVIKHRRDLLANPGSHFGALHRQILQGTGYWG
jgi:hypothetical protein